jgi:hypothetical protein
MVTDTTVSYTNIEYLKKMVEVCWEREFCLSDPNPLHPKYQRLGNEGKFMQIRIRTARVELLDFKDYPLSIQNTATWNICNYRGARKYSLFIDKVLKKVFWKRRINKIH